MNPKINSHLKLLWIYAALPAVILNIGAVLIFGSYYALQATQPDLVASIQPDQVQFLAYVFVFIVEWIFAILLLRQRAAGGKTLGGMIAPAGQIFGFRRLHTLGLFIVVNILI